MKVGSFLIMSASLATSFGQQASRLLRVPKIYNTLIASDEELLPSLAYKAVSPVVKSVAPNPYHPYPAYPAYPAYPHYQPYAPPVVNVAEHEPVLIPPQEAYQNRFQQDPHVPIYEHKGVYNDLISSLLSLNQSLANAESGTVPPEEPPRGKAKQEIFGDIRNNRNRNPSIPDVPPPPLPVRIKDDERQEAPSRGGQEYPPPAVGAI